MKIHLVGAELFHAYRQTELMKLIIGFRKFANPPTRDWRYAFTPLHAFMAGTGT